MSVSCGIVSAKLRFAPLRSDDDHRCDRARASVDPAHSPQEQVMRRRVRARRMLAGFAPGSPTADRASSALPHVRRRRRDHGLGRHAAHRLGPERAGPRPVRGLRRPTSASCSRPPSTARSTRSRSSSAAPLIAVTENNWIYGMNPATGAITWSRSVGPAWPASTLGCGDLVPNIGITSTPVYDPATSAVFFMAKVNDGTDAGAPALLHALDRPGDRRRAHRLAGHHPGHAEQRPGQRVQPEDRRPAARACCCSTASSTPASPATATTARTSATSPA